MARGLGGAALPVAGARQRGRIDAADPDAREMLRGDRRVLQETQRDPAGGEFLFGLVDVAGGERGIARDQIGGAVLADIDHLAREQPPLDPPFINIIEPAGIPWRAEHQLRGVGEFLFAAKQLNLAEDIAGIAVQFARHFFKQCARVGRFAISRDPRPRERDLPAPSRFAARSAASCSGP